MRPFIANGNLYADPGFEVSRLYVVTVQPHLFEAASTLLDAAPVLTNHKIAFIRALRIATDCGLREAKDAIDAAILQMQGEGVSQAEPIRVKVTPSLTGMEPCDCKDYSQSNAIGSEDPGDGPGF